MAAPNVGNEGIAVEYLRPSRIAEPLCSVQYIDIIFRTVKDFTNKSRGKKYFNERGRWKIASILCDTSSCSSVDGYQTVWRHITENITGDSFHSERNSMDMYGRQVRSSLPAHLPLTIRKQVSWGHYTCIISTGNSAIFCGTWSIATPL